jgi:hypothetical protein
MEHPIPMKMVNMGQIGDAPGLSAELRDGGWMAISPNEPDASGDLDSVLSGSHSDRRDQEKHYVREGYELAGASRGCAAWTTSCPGHPRGFLPRTNRTPLGGIRDRAKTGDME